MTCCISRRGEEEERKCRGSEVKQALESAKRHRIAAAMTCLCMYERKRKWKSTRSDLLKYPPVTLETYVTSNDM